VYRPAERSRVAEPDVVDEHDQDVGRAFRRLHLEARGRRRLARIDFGNGRVRRLREREHRSIDSRGNPCGFGCLLRRLAAPGHGQQDAQGGS